MNDTPPPSAESTAQQFENQVLCAAVLDLFRSGALSPGVHVTRQKIAALHPKTHCYTDAEIRSPLVDLLIGVPFDLILDHPQMVDTVLQYLGLTEGATRHQMTSKRLGALREAILAIVHRCLGAARPALADKGLENPDRSARQSEAVEGDIRSGCFGESEPEPRKVLSAPVMLSEFKRCTARLIDDARACGVVIRVDLAPRQPPAMGAYDMIADVRLARGQY